MHRRYDFQFGTFFLIAGGLQLATFFLAPFSMPIIGLAEQLGQDNGYTGIEVGMVMAILSTALFSCYWGLRLLLHSPITPKKYQVHLTLLTVLCFLAEGAFFWLYQEIRDLPQPVSWGGYSIGLLINFFVLLTGVAHLYMARRRMFDPYPEEDDMDDDMSGQKRQPTTIGQEIYVKYSAQRKTSWDFSATDAQKVKHFYPIPYLPDPDDWLMLRTPVRVILEMMRSGYDDVLTIGLDLYGDMVFGRSQNRRPGRITLDLTDYDCRDLGVSRNHLLVRPTTDGIYIVDLGSRYGTTLNGETLDGHTAVLLPGDCEIILGQRVIFRVTFVNPPSE